ncbi:MAG: hypothetical protein MH219_13870 [Marinobacter sp.]|nr:hypothetical protein [Marinobacter sp.]
MNDRTAKLTTDSDGLGVTENYRFCYEPWAKATGTEPPKKNNTNPANANSTRGYGMEAKPQCSSRRRDCDC